MSLFKIVSDVENSAWLLLLWGDEPWGKVLKSLFFKKLTPLFSTQSLEEARQLFLEIEKKVAKQFVLRSLSKKSFLSLELCRKMGEKGISKEAAFEAISFCEKIGALDDQRWLELKMESSLRKGKGPLHLQAKYRTYGISSSFALDSEREKQALILVLQKKRKGSNAALSFQEKSSLYRFLLGRGFQKTLIEEVLNSYF